MGVVMLLSTQNFFNISQVAPVGRRGRRGLLVRPIAARAHRTGRERAKTRRPLP